MAERSSFVEPGFRPYQRELNQQPQTTFTPVQKPVTYRVLSNGQVHREDTEVKGGGRNNLPMSSELRDTRGVRVLPPLPPEATKSQLQNAPVYRVRADGTTYREQPDQDNTQYQQQQQQNYNSPRPRMVTQGRDIRGTKVKDESRPEPTNFPGENAPVYRVRSDGTTYLEQSNRNNTNDRDIRGTTVNDDSYPEPTNVPSPDAPVYRVRPDGSTYREQPKRDSTHDREVPPQRHVTYRLRPDGSTYKEEIVHDNGNYNQTPVRIRDKEDSLTELGLARRPGKSISQGGVHRWAMFRLWVNREISQEVRKEKDPKKEIQKRLDLPMDSMVTSVLVDPQSDVNGKRLQKQYGPNSVDGRRFHSILPENIFFVFGIPRAKTYIDSSVSEFMETMSNAVARSEYDALSTKDGLSTKDDTGRTERNVKEKDFFDRNKDETNYEEKYRRWHASDLKKSRNVSSNDEKEKKWREDTKQTKSETGDFDRSRKWKSDLHSNDWSRDTKDWSRDTKARQEADDVKNYATWDDDDDDKKQINGLGKSRSEEFTDFARFHVNDDYDMPNKKRKENKVNDFSNTKTESENLYATRVNK
ncbi:uncharacterized protein [Argopecten irradians]|uniref:uncharacterized protein n=1 Tax=Argopecten irradians TaxID=31199 RepID=UPI003714C9AB